MDPAAAATPPRAAATAARPRRRRRHETTTTTYTYVVDVTFSANGRTRRIKGLEKLAMLPSQAAPLLIFLGVTAEGGNAVFLVDSTLKAAGEGSCKPSGPTARSPTSAPAPSTTSPTRTATATPCAIDEIRKVEGPRRSAERANAGKADRRPRDGAVRHARGASRRRCSPTSSIVASEQARAQTATATADRE